MKDADTNHDRFPQALDTLMEGCQIVDRNWRYIYVNEAAAKHGRRQRSDLLGHTMMECYPGIEKTKLFSLLQDCMNRRCVHGLENEFTYPDGTKGWFELRIEPLPEGLFILSFDITERHLAEWKQQELLSLFASIAAHIPGVIYEFRRQPDGTECFSYASQKLRTVYGVAPESAAKDASPVFQNIHPEDREHVRKCIDDSAEHLTRCRDQFRVILPDGRTIWVETDATPNKSEDGTIIWHGYAADISERKRMDQQILRAQRLESVGSLAGGVVHDMNNILGPIMMALQMMRMRLTDPKDQYLLDLLETNSNRGADLIKQILMFVRGAESQKTVLQLRHVINEVVKFARETFPASIQIQADMRKDLKTVMADPTQMQQVLLNLVVNARDAMKGGGSLKIQAENITLSEEQMMVFKDAKPGAYVLIRVKDTGAGISPDIKDMIFEPFFTTKEQGKGTGLGLSTVLTIVKSHDGFVDVSSVVGEGTEFRIYFPATDFTGRATKDTSLGEVPRGNGEMILLVDDEAAVREISKVALEANGYEVLIAKEGAEAIGHFTLNQDKVKLVITDIDMPFIDGPKLTGMLRKFNPKIRVIGSSGSDDKVNQKELEEAHMDAYLTKPYSSETLLRTIGEVLKKE